MTIFNIARNSELLRTQSGSRFLRSLYAGRGTPVAAAEISAAAASAARLR
jgi:hypothetical protein